MWRDADDDLEDREYPEPDEDDSDETAPCPHCRAPIHEESERCPRCGRYLSREDAPRRRPRWVVVGALACLAVVVWWIVTLA